MELIRTGCPPTPSPGETRAGRDRVRENRTFFILLT